jgi:hypothetical protein
MGRTACTEPQCLYKGDFYLLLYVIFIFLDSKLEDRRFCTKWLQAFPDFKSTLNILQLDYRPLLLALFFCDLVTCCLCLFCYITVDITIFLSFCDLKWRRMTSRTVQPWKVCFSWRQTNKWGCICTSEIVLLCRSTVQAGFSHTFWRPLCFSRVIGSSQDLRSALFWDVTQRRVVIPYRLFETAYHFHLRGSRGPRFG